MMNQARGHMEFIYSFLEYPNALCEEDWKIWRPLIENFCAQITDEEFIKKGVEAMRFLNFHFYEEK